MRLHPEERAAIELVEQYGDDPPVNVERIAKQLKITIVRQALDQNISGILYREDGTAIIGVNSRHPESRQRFTIAHEIGHFVLHPGERVIVERNGRVNLRDGRSNQAIVPEEIQANRFAAELLMPRRRVLEALRTPEAPATAARDVAVLADRFSVSSQAMEYRLVNLGMLVPR
jgi:Zn-dependent peptidase ImmA (M78 family)